MNNSLELTLPLPCTVFTTFNRFNDTTTDDMQCGDMDSNDLRRLGLTDISIHVDPYHLIKFDPYRVQLSDSSEFNMFNTIPAGTSISRKECSDILFDEMRELSTQFSYGLYSSLIGDMIDYFQYGNGMSYRSELLNKAFADLIWKTRFSNSYSVIENEIGQYFRARVIADSRTHLNQQITKGIYTKALPKFSRFQDKYNGLGITVHDITAQEITLVQLSKSSRDWRVLVRFKAQDHFGLDKTDIANPVFKKLRFFRIWFFLQRHRDFACRPFFTDFVANVHLQGQL